MKTRDGAQGTQTFGLIEKTEKDFGNFFVFEIHEMETRGFPFKDFKFGSIDWLSQRFQGKTTVRNTEDITFNGAEARKYEVELNDSKEPTPVELYAVNGVSRYYLLLYFKNATDGPVVKRIMDSIVFDK
jgi:hypothetical protein